MEIPKDNYLVDARDLHVEILDTSVPEVWQTRLPVTVDWFHALELPPGFAKIGIGRGAMDAHAFRRSPGADADGPLRARDLGGETFICCARPPAEGFTFPAGPDGPRRLIVDKHHTLVFHPGREVAWLRLPDGSEYVHVIDGSAGAPALPEGWTRTLETLAEERTLHLPHPTTAFFFPNGDGYQGPVER